MVFETELEPPNVMLSIDRDGTACNGIDSSAPHTKYFNGPDKVADEYGKLIDKSPMRELHMHSSVLKSEDCSW